VIDLSNGQALRAMNRREKLSLPTCKSTPTSIKTMAGCIAQENYVLNQRHFPLRCFSFSLPFPQPTTTQNNPIPRVPCLGPKDVGRELCAGL
jgi:hypothetical protein